MEGYRAKFGIDKLDKALGGGVPSGSDILLKNTAGTPKNELLKSYMLEGLREDHPCWLLNTLSYGEDMFREEEIEKYGDDLIFIDAFSNPYDTKNVKPHTKHAITDISNIGHIQNVIRDATENMKTNRSRGVIDSFTQILKTIEIKPKIKHGTVSFLTSDVLEYIVTRKPLLREYNASMIYTVNPDAHNQELMSTLEDIVDSVISMDRVKTGGDFKSILGKGGRELKSVLTVEKLNRSNFSSREMIMEVENGRIKIEK